MYKIKLPGWSSWADNSDRSPRNRRPWTSSGPEGSSDKWSLQCRGSIPVTQLSVLFSQPGFLFYHPFISWHVFKQTYFSAI